MSKARPDGKKKEKTEKTAEEKARGWRETVESIIIAVILAFLFRAFEAEAFVIPTGSMAPTLQGRHYDVQCKECQHWYRTGASDDRGNLMLVGSTCPICRYTMPLDYFSNPNERPFSGDRILVNKFAYELSPPERWDVIVFKYPGNAKVNYIKRLVGLPGERLRVQYGNVYVRHQQDAGYHIARKPPDKVKAMLQLVDDTHHVAPSLVEAGWPSRWQAWSKGGQPGKDWSTSEDGKTFATAGSSKDSWLRYRHLIPSFEDWGDLKRGKVPPDLNEQEGQLITDFYAYNCSENQELYQNLMKDGPGSYDLRGPWGYTLGLNWVPDLAVECDAEVTSESGELLLELVEGGVHYECRINVADGKATLSIDGGFAGFEDEQGAAQKHPSAATKVKGKGRYRLRLANVDDQIFLWVNDWPVKFDGPTTYGPVMFAAPANVKPAWSEADPGDLAPAGVGTNGAGLNITRLRILRDVYYIACNQDSSDIERYRDISPSQDADERDFFNPASWSHTRLFDTRRAIEFPDNRDPNSYLGPDHFFPMGDNSPASKDGRLWSEFGDPPPYVDRKLLIGKALLIYWPHTWNRPVPFMPNPGGMGLIR